jgi:hypothetical protein
MATLFSVKLEAVTLPCDTATLTPSTATSIYHKNIQIDGISKSVRDDSRKKFTNIIIVL